MQTNIIFKIFDGLFLVLIIYIIFATIMKLLGTESLGFEEIVVALLVANIGYTFYIKDRVQNMEETILNKKK